MRNNFKYLIKIWLVNILCCWGLSLQANNNINITEVNAEVNQLITQVTDKLAPHIGKLKSNSPIVQEIMEQNLLPRVNFEAMSRRILLSYWKTASASQKQIFISKFSKLLVNNYAKLFENYAGQRIVLRAKLTRLSSDQKRAEVRTLIKSDDRPDINVNLRLIKTSQWKVYDLVIDGISLVKNYQAQLMPSLKRGGINAAIDKLAKH